MDTADRAVACEAAKFLARAGRLEEAVAVMGLFTKPGEPVLEYLVETQCTWFLVELAKAHLARGERGEALVRCAQLRDIFQEVEEDQLDFHLFSMYRMRLSHYVQLLRFEDQLRTLLAELEHRLGRTLPLLLGRTLPIPLQFARR